MLGISLKQVPHIYHHDVVSNKDKDVRKGCLKIKVGEGEEQQKITVPVNYLNHPLFVQLLKEAEEEYGFAQQGTITIPCQVEDFKHVQYLIHRDKSHHHLVPCFRV